MTTLQRFGTDQASAEILGEICRLCNVAHAAVVPRLIEVAGRPFRTGYVEAVATLPTRQRRGLGASVIAESAVVVRQEYELGVLSTGLYDFYGRLSWERWQGPTYVRRSSGLIRTANEDDGVMVLRFGPSANVSLTATISFEARTGDDW